MNPDTIRPPRKAVLASLMTDTKGQEEVEQYCKAVWVDYPKGCDLLYIWRMCLLSGIHIPYFDRVEKAVYVLQNTGWEQIPATEKPIPTDIAVFSRGKFGMGIEFVAKVMTNSEDYYGLGPEGYGRRNRRSREEVSSSEDRAVIFFLRYTCIECNKKKENA